MGTQRRYAANHGKRQLKNSSGFAFVRRHPRLANVLLLVTSLVVTVLVIDLFTFYVLDIRRLGHGPERFFQRSSLLGWEHIPYAEGTWYAYKDGTRTHVSINAYGFPDADRTPGKSRKRIALIGDSTTEFWEVEEPRRAQFVIQDLLHGQVEALNFGLRGAGTDQEFVRFTNQVVHFSPDVVVLFFCVNDLGNNVTTESKPYFVLDDAAPGGLRLAGLPIRAEAPDENPWLRDFLEQSFTLRQLKYLTTGVIPQLRVNVPLETHFELRPYKRVYDAEDARRLELLRRLLAAFAAEARQRNIHLLLVEGLYRPALDKKMRQQVLDAYGDQFDFDKVSRTLAEISLQEGIEFLSLPKVVHDRGLDVRDLMHPEDTMHLNAAGVRVFASSVVERVRRLGWLGDGRQVAAPEVR